MTRRALPALTALLGLLALPASAADLEVTFSVDEVETIQAFYRDQHKGAQGRGRGRGGLPPGIAKNLERGKPLPPGIAKQSLPAELERRLPPVPDGYERIVVEGKILLIEAATRVIRDVLSDVLFD